jgi:hypothetical protein
MDEAKKQHAGQNDPQQKLQLQQQTPVVNGNREVPSALSSPQEVKDTVATATAAVKTETMTNDDGGVEAQVATTPVTTQEEEKTYNEPGQWLLAQLEKSNSYDIDNDKKHPEHDPEMLYIRFPFMACEIICCELESVIETLVQGYAVYDDPVPPPQAAAVLLKKISTAQAADGSESVEVLPADNKDDTEKSQSTTTTIIGFIIRCPL